jgi:hypothetical protein
MVIINILYVALRKIGKFFRKVFKQNRNFPGESPQAVLHQGADLGMSRLAASQIKYGSPFSKIGGHNDFGFKGLRQHFPSLFRRA